jgi:predicted phosphoadenosine phosphosulfate sulfurtransferase
VNDDEFVNYLDSDVPMNHNIFKYLMVTRNKLRQHKRVAVSYSSGSDSDIILDLACTAIAGCTCGEVLWESCA